MKREKHKSQVAQLMSQQNTNRFTIVALVIVIFGLIFSMAKLAGSSKTTIIPPTIEEPFWVTDSQVDTKYLEAVGIFLANLGYNVTPDTYEYQASQLIRWAHPRVYGEIERRNQRLANKIERNRVSMSFAPEQVVRSAAAEGEVPSIAVVGRLERRVGTKTTTRERLAVVMDFDVIAGRVYLTRYVESVDPEHPFAAVKKVEDM